jgi:hypothetical protein
MNTAPLHQKKDLHLQVNASEEEAIQEGLYPFQHEQNITEGGEFLDDAIRMKDQPLLQTTAKGNE